MKTKPNEVPMLFSAPMVLELLGRRKSQTRRIIDFKDPGGRLQDPGRCRLSSLNQLGQKMVATFGDSIPDDPVPLEVACPYGMAGTRIWARETWGYRGAGWTNRKPDVKDVYIRYRADDVERTFVRAHDDNEGLPKLRKPKKRETREEWAAYLDTYWAQWRPSIFMCRWMSRLTLIVKGIRCERLQDISEGDAAAEGIQAWTKDRALMKYGVEPGEPGALPWGDMPRTAVGAYRLLWERINGPGSWELNPWVWVVDFSVMAESAVTEPRSRSA